MVLTIGEESIRGDETKEKAKEKERRREREKKAKIDKERGREKGNVELFLTFI